MAPSSCDVTGGPSKVSFYNRVRHEGVFSTAVVCRSRHDFFTYSLLQYTGAVPTIQALLEANYSEV